MQGRVGNEREEGCVSVVGGGESKEGRLVRWADAAKEHWRYCGMLKTPLTSTPLPPSPPLTTRTPSPTHLCACIGVG